jgi:hypothetical protein
MDNVEIYLKDTGCEGSEWIHLAQVRGQWRAVVEHDNEASGSTFHILEKCRLCGLDLSGNAEP